MSAEAPKARILTVEDEAPMRDALKAVLECEGYEVWAEADGTAIAAAAAEFGPDLAILDVHLPVGPDGYAIARRLRQGGDLPIVFLTAAGQHEEQKEGFEAGADDYVVKPFAMEQLLWRVEAVLRRSGRLCTPVRVIADLTVDDDAGQAVRAGQVLALTRIEQRLLSVLARDAGRVLSKEQLLHRVWGYEAYDPNLVEVHISSLRKKLEAHGPRLVHTVRGKGYVARA